MWEFSGRGTMAYSDSDPYTLSRYPELAVRMTRVTGNYEFRFGYQIGPSIGLMSVLR